MLTQEQVLDAIKSGRESACLDERDYMRLCAFFPESELETFGFSLNDGDTWEPRPFTEEEVKKQLAGDLSFGFEKAIDQRGISASSMYEVVLMWMWVLEDPLQHHNSYANYGLPLFQKVAGKYGLPDPTKS